MRQDPLSLFHPLIATWFRDTLGDPTPVQERAWEAIRRGTHTLIAAPTGSGKTLAAFLTILNDLVIRSCDGELAQETSVLYVSPLKALSNDVEKNLNRPLREIQDAFFNSELRKVDVRVAVRTGDTPPGERAAMVKHNPHILITTPESLFLLLTSKGGRDMLKRVRTVIVDEIHALVGEKRGAHLALSLERLQELAGESMVRIGLSATQKPIEEVSRFLTGGADCVIIDTGHRRKMDLQVEIPDSPLTAVMANEVWDEVYARIEQLVSEHQTTLLFVNTRRLAERMAHRLSESLGEDKVAAHHGSLSKDRRFTAEQRLKSGQLAVLVATASLELGIDIGSVDLVIQVACPRSISSFLQRVGRSGHAVGGTPKGRLFPLTRDELIEAAALLDAVRHGDLDTLVIPAKPLDILAQQIVAETACREWSGEKLFEVFKRAYPYRDLKLEEFREIAEMLGQGFTTRRGRRGAHVHLDGVNDRLRGRPGARLTALTNGGAIPDTFDYDVKLEPGNTLLGSVNEDFAIDSSAGDIFQLGNNSWMILRVEGSTVRVADAHGQPPTIPFWFGESPGRSQAFSIAVSRLREEISARLGETAVLQEKVELQGSGPGAPWKVPSLEWLTSDVGILAPAAEQIIDYLASAKLSLGVMPSRGTLVLERFFDDAGDMHMILHSPFGSRVNRAWGLSLRKRFCKKFNFELQAAATEDGIILSLGATHSFPLDEVFQYLRSGSVRHILIQALLDAPMFEVRWRWNATRALAIQRNRNGKKVPPQLQRMAAEDLVALVFPDQRACFENIQGEREVPDHPLVRQTISDCLHEAMDIDTLEGLLADIEAGRLILEARDLKEPSPLAQEVINARPYAFLDDAPLEERRTRAIQSRRYLDPAEAGDLGRLDPLAIAAVRAEAWPQVRGSDELHDALMLTGFLTETEIAEWPSHLETLKADNRVACVRAVPRSVAPRFADVDGGIDLGSRPVWVAAERLEQALAAFPGAEILWRAGASPVTGVVRPANDALAKGPGCGVPGAPVSAGPVSAGKAPAKAWTEEDALVEIVRGRMESLGPTCSADVTASIGLRPERIELALLALEQEGFILRGRFTPGCEGTEWCERRLLARIHRYTLAKLRREIEPVSAADYMRFLFSWQGLDGDAKPGTIDHGKAAGPEGVEAVLARLEGFEAPGAAWENEILPARLARYEPGWLDLQSLSGGFIWGRVRPGIQPQGVEGRKPGPVKATPIAFLGRQNLDHWLSVHAAYAQGQSGSEGWEAPEPEGAAAVRMLQHLRQRGASFWRDILWETGLTATEAREAIAELVTLGWLTSDGFRGLRALIHGGNGSGKDAASGLERSGRWSLLRQTQPRGNGLPGNLPQAGNPPQISANAPFADSAATVMPGGPTHRGNRRENPGLEAIARVLLQRYGVVFRKLADRENLVPPWRDLVRAFRTLEARGEIRGGRFVEGVYGEQFALPEAVAQLRLLRKKDKNGALLSLSAADPANLQGVITPGPRVPATRKNRILFRDGEPVAVLEAGEMRVLPGHTLDVAGESRLRAVS
ncbi:MAG: box helicase domain protein [Fibrobacteres bacterium]|nr:box helicase domain protein [Fibrobacterota bacterium]